MIPRKNTSFRLTRFLPNGKCRCSEGEKKAAAVFHVLQLDPTFVNGDLDYMKVDLVLGGRLCITDCGLTGTVRFFPTDGSSRRKYLNPTRLCATVLVCRIRSLDRCVHCIRCTLCCCLLLSPCCGTTDCLISASLATSLVSVAGHIPSHVGAMAALRILILRDNDLNG